MRTILQSRVSSIRSLAWAGVATLLPLGCGPMPADMEHVLADAADSTTATSATSSTSSATTTGSSGTGSVGTSGGSTSGSSTSTSTTTPSTGTPAPPAAVLGNSSNAIHTADGGLRTDPEGVAAAESATDIVWRDARGAERKISLGSYLHQYDFSFHDNTQVVERSANDDAWGHEGFGYVVSHAANGNSPLGKANTPTAVTTEVFAGGHHALHRVELTYDRDKEAGGYGVRIPIVIEWMVATGRDHPIWAVTWKMGSATNPSGKDFTNDYTMDVRGPYGSLNFDGAATRGDGDAIGGVAWGDYLYRFETSDAEFNLNSPWTYNAPNYVNFVRAWTESTNAEMGIVQTRGGDVSFPRGDRVVGAERGATSADAFPGKGDCKGFSDARSYSVPCINGWPYQLMNYDWSGAKPAGEGTSTKLLAWGSPYGWLGARSFDSFDGGSKLDGRGDRSYATFIVLGPKQRYDTATGLWDQPGDVQTAVTEVESLVLAAISDVSVGSLATQAPKGPGASENKTLMNGYDDTYATYNVNAAGNHVKFSFTPDAGHAVSAPIFVVHNFTGRTVPTVLVNGKAVTVNTGDDGAGAFVSIRESANELWVTLNRKVSAVTQIEILAE